MTMKQQWRNYICLVLRDSPNAERGRGTASSTSFFGWGGGPRGGLVTPVEFRALLIGEVVN